MKLIQDLYYQHDDSKFEDPIAALATDIWCLWFETVFG